MNKLLSVLFALLLSITMLGAVSAATSDDYTIEDVEIDGLYADSYDQVYVERSSTLSIDAVLNGTGDADDVKVKAWLGGYEYADVEDVIGPFDLEAGVARAIHLKLAIPEDLDTSEGIYTLYIEAYDGVNELSVSYPVKVEEIRHSLKVQDVIFRPSSSVAPGEYLRAVVRVENLGAKDEEDIKVTLKIPELGISQRDYIDELVAVEDDEDDEETSQSSNEIMVQIPENAKAGDYEVVVDVEYNRGHDILSKKSLIHVEGATAEQVEAIISIDATSKQLAQGSEVAYKLMFANLGDGAEVYSVAVAGAELWANSRVDPAFITVQPGQTGELFVYLSAKSDAEAGNKMFTVKINSGANTVKEINLNAEITAQSATNWGSFKNVLEIAFAVLVILLIIMGLIIAFKRPSKSSEGSDSEDKSYY